MTLKLSKALQLFLSSYKNASTRKTYSDILTPLVTSIGPGRSVSNIQAVDLLDYIQEIHQRPYADATVYKYLKSIKRFFNWMVQMDILTVSPARNLKNPRPKRHHDRQKAMTDSELNVILSVTRWQPRNYALILFIADTGCRAGGVANLRLEDLHLDKRMAYVLEKGNKRRPVWFADEAVHALRLWLIRRPDWSHDFVFGSKSGRMSSASISQIIRRACLKGGLRSLGSHSLRHRKGHQLADDGIPVTVAATILGHEDPTITMIYYPDSLDRAEKAVRRLATKPAAPTALTNKIIRGNF